MSGASLRHQIIAAALLVLVLRVMLTVWVLPISTTFPQTDFERQVSPQFGQAPVQIWLQRIAVAPWARYDAEHYASIVESGYREPMTAAFHPLYPLLARPIAWLLGGNTLLALLLVSTGATIVLFALFLRYVAQVHGDIAQPALWLLVALPPSMMMLAPYNEGLFLALAVGCFLALQHERWWLAGLLGGLAALTRQQGLALVLPLAWAVLAAWRGGRAHWWHMAVVGLIPLGYALVVGYRAVTLGDLAVLTQAQGPAEFIRNLLVSPKSEAVVVGQRIAWPWEAPVAQIGLIIADPGRYELIIDLLLGMAGVLVVLLGLSSMTWSERLYALTIVLLTLCYYNGSVRPCLSMPRHMLLAFPICIALARWTAQRPILRASVFTAMLLVNFFLFAGYVRHGWIP